MPNYGDNVMFALTFPPEFRSIQAHYPIVFRKAAEGQFQPIALFGFTEKQNLFLKPGGWDATYLPLMVETATVPDRRRRPGVDDSRRPR